MDSYRSRRSPSLASCQGGSMRSGSGFSGSMAHYNPLSPVAEEEKLFVFDSVMPDYQLDKALNSIVNDEVNPLLSAISCGIDVTKTYEIVSCGLPSAQLTPSQSFARFSVSRSSLASRAASRDSLTGDHGPAAAGDNSSVSYGSLTQALGGFGSPPQCYPYVGPVTRATLLHVAVVHKALKCLKFLIHLGAPLEEHESYRQDTALLIAVRVGALPLTLHLLECGADIQARNARGDTPLHVASAMGRVALTRVLVDSGAVIMARNRYNETPWEQATSSGSASSKVCADLLLTRHCQRKEEEATENCA